MPELSAVDLERRSTAEMVAASLRERLLAGDYAPGTPMRESALAPQLGVSRATMREALQHLVHEGLLTYHMHRGMVVTDLSADDVRDIYGVRRLIEAAAVAGAAPRHPGLDEVAAALDANAAAVASGDVGAAVETDMAFHRAIAALSDSSRLESCHREALGQLRLVLNMLDRSKGDLTAQLREHRKILRRVRGGEPVEAEALITAHLDQAERNLLRFLGA